MQNWPNLDFLQKIYPLVIEYYLKYASGGRDTKINFTGLDEIVDRFIHLRSIANEKIEFQNYALDLIE
jgi:hypothetical protein